MSAADLGLARSTSRATLEDLAEWRAGMSVPLVGTSIAPPYRDAADLQGFASDMSVGGIPGVSAMMSESDAGYASHLGSRRSSCTVVRGPWLLFDDFDHQV